MRQDRHVPAHRLVDQRLAGGVGQVVVAADDVRHAHVVVVDHDREHVGRRAVRAQQDQVVERLVLPGDAALHRVLDDGLAVARRLAAARRRARPGPGRRIGVAPGRAEERRPALGPGRARGRRRSPRPSRSSGRPCRAPASRARPRRGAPRGSNWLTASPSQSSPSQRRPVEDRLGRLGRRARAVGVLDAQQEPAAAHGAHRAS